MSKKRSIANSFIYAFDGIKEAFQNEPNFRIHLVVSIVVIIAGYYFNLSQQEWITLIIVITLVIVLELINTAIEAIVDLASPKFHRLAKISKDVSAAAVLISSVMAFIIGLLIFSPRIISLF